MRGGLSQRIALIGGIFLLLDQGLKFLARTNPGANYYIARPWLGWEFFANPGIAFSLPVPQFLMIVGTPVILLWLYYVVSKEKQVNKLALPGLLLIIFGAASNFIDRLLFGYTVDYLRIIAGIINIADIMIVAGVVMMLWGEKEKE